MTWVAVGSAAVTVVGGALQSRSNKKAAKAQEQAQLAGQQQYQQNVQPYLTLGQSATGQLQGLLQDPSSFAENPAYQFARDQGLQALDRSAAARGGLYSGGADVDRLRYASGLASQEYGNQFNRLYNLASLGQNAATNAGSQALQTQQNIGQIGAERAINQANIYSSGLQSLGTAFGQYMGNRQQPQQRPTSIYSFGNNAQWGQGVPGAGGYG